MAKTKKRGNGDGTVFKRNGKWKGSVTLGKDANGKLIRKWRTGEALPQRDALEALETCGDPTAVLIPAVQR